jgi:hypothetical protein
MGFFYTVRTVVNRIITEGNKKLIVLYPDPPLGAEELKVLNEIDEKIIFITPIYLPTL